MQILLNPTNYRPPVPYVPRNLIPCLTPWQRVIRKFNVCNDEMARMLNRDRSQFWRVRNSCGGLISSNYQIRLIRLAKQRGVDLRPEDLVPEF